MLSQLGNRFQHALRAYTPSEQRGLKSASDSFRANPAFDTAEAIQALGVGEALVSTLDEKGAPRVVARTLVRPPSSRLGPATPEERQAVMAKSPVRGVYDQAANRESAHELLTRRAAEAQATERDREEPRAPSARSSGRAPKPRASTPRRSNRQSAGEAFTKSVVRSVGSQLGRSLIRGILGGLTRGR